MLANLRPAAAALVLFTATLSAQKPADQQNFTFTVVNAHANPLQPVNGVQLSLSYLDGSTRITDTRDLTNREGRVFLRVTTDALQRDLRVEVACRDTAACSAAKDLVIFQPADGQLPSVLPPSVTIQLLPKGSPALLGPAQIEAILHRALLQLNSVESQNHALRREVADNKNQQRDLSEPLAEWARANGFTVDEANQHVQQWAQQIQQDKTNVNLQQKALAELALKHYGAAAQLFDQVTDADAAELDDVQRAFLEKSRAVLRKLLSAAQQEASTLQLNMQHHQATLKLASVNNRAAAQLKLFPDDPDLRAIHLRAMLLTADARSLEAELAPAEQCEPLQAEAATDLREVLKQYLEIGDIKGAARTELSLGGTLDSERACVAGDKVAAMEDEAVSDFRKALDVYTREKTPKMWARIQVYLGFVLVGEAQRATGETARDLFNQAEQAYRNALGVYAETNFSNGKAVVQLSLGDLLMNEAEFVGGAAARPLLEKAVQAIRSSLEILTKTAFPIPWAFAENKLASALVAESKLSTDDQAITLLEEAAQTTRGTLDVFTRAALPRRWAATQEILGEVLKAEGDKASGDKAMELLDQARQAYLDALEVTTRTVSERSWADLQNDLGNVLRDEGDRGAGDKAAALLDQAVQAYRNALEVTTRAVSPRGWAMLMDNLAVAAGDEADHGSGDKSIALHQEAVQDFQSLLDVYTRGQSPRNWAQLQTLIGEQLNAEARNASPPTASSLLDQAVKRYGSALEIIDKTKDPQSWARAMRGLAAAHKAQGDTASSDAELKAANEVAPLPAVRQ